MFFDPLDKLFAQIHLQEVAVEQAFFGNSLVCLLDVAPPPDFLYGWEFRAHGGIPVQDFLGSRITHIRAVLGSPKAVRIRLRIRLDQSAHSCLPDIERDRITR